MPHDQGLAFTAAGACALPAWYFLRIAGTSASPRWSRQPFNMTVNSSPGARSSGATYDASQICALKLPP
jgi:hypothetical protein